MTITKTRAALVAIPFLVGCVLMTALLVITWPLLAVTVRLRRALEWLLGGGIVITPAGHQLLAVNHGGDGDAWE